MDSGVLPMGSRGFSIPKGRLKHHSASALDTQKILTICNLFKIPCNCKTYFTIPKNIILAAFLLASIKLELVQLQDPKTSLTLIYL